MSDSTARYHDVVGNPTASLYENLNTRWHKVALLSFLAIVLFHWTEHIIQAYQFFVLNWTRQMSMGLVGMYYPWLMKTEVLHYGFALVMVIALWILRKGFTGTSHKWWMAAFWIQFWHHFRALHFILSGADASLLVRRHGTDERRSDLDSADRAASHLQRAGIHSDGSRDVLS